MNLVDTNNAIDQTTTMKTKIVLVNNRALVLKTALQQIAAEPTSVDTADKKAAAKELIKEIDKFLTTKEQRATLVLATFSKRQAMAEAVAFMMVVANQVLLSFGDSN